MKESTIEKKKIAKKQTLELNSVSFEKPLNQFGLNDRSIYEIN